MKLTENIVVRNTEFARNLVRYAIILFPGFPALHTERSPDIPGIFVGFVPHSAQHKNLKIPVISRFRTKDSPLI